MIGLASSCERHCLLPNTLFRRSGSGSARYVSAAELLGTGGEDLIGPGDSSTRVLRTTKIDSARRDLVVLRVAHSVAAFTVTADHRLLVGGADAQISPMVARSVVRAFEEGTSQSVYDGCS